ncbi:MAG TPA: hypothetical protein VKZ60_13390 [Chloroflexota bacterium]|nr:hypothetical protein [Chloroflexota bacterium]
MRRQATRLVAAAVVALAVLAAVAGTALGARGATADNAQALRALSLDAPAASPVATAPRPGFTAIVGRVAAVREQGLLVRTPEGLVTVRVLPRTVIKRAGERVELAALQRGDGVLVVGKLTERGVLRAWGIRARPPGAARGQAAPSAPGPSGGE